MEQIIVCAANRLDDGTIICGARHWDTIMNRIADKVGWDDCRLAEQGFIDQLGNFLTREEALEIAKRNGQIKRRCGGDEHELFSENLY